MRDERDDPYSDPYDPHQVPDDPSPRPGDPHGTGTTTTPQRTVNPRWNGGSPPATPLPVGADGKTTHGWTWTGSDEYDPNGTWTQTPGSGIGFGQYNVGGGPPRQNSGGTQSGQSRPGGSPVAGVPSSYGGGAWNPQAILGGSVPTLDDAIAGAKKLQAAPTVTPYAQFQAPAPVGLEQRNQIAAAILNNPQVLNQQTQDSMFEQQKELQTSLAQQSRERAAQQGAGRGLSATGGYAAATNADTDHELSRNLLAARRDISVKAAEINRQSELAALQMQEAMAQGDFQRAQAAYQTQLQAQNLYDELRFKAAEFDRANVALAAQTQMAGRQQSMAEQVASFQQYLAQKQFDEQMRQFNEQMGLNWSRFGWDQIIGATGAFK